MGPCCFYAIPFHSYSATFLHQQIQMPCAVSYSSLFFQQKGPTRPAFILFKGTFRASTLQRHFFLRVTSPVFFFNRSSTTKQTRYVQNLPIKSLKHFPPRCSHCLILKINWRMVHRGDLVIIGISAGLTIGILLASLVFFGIRWYKKSAHLRRCATTNSTCTLPIRSNGLASSIDSSLGTTDSVSVKGLDDLANNSKLSWSRNRSKDRFGSASGILRYSHKDIQKATQNFTTTLGHGAFGSVYKATMVTGEVVAVKVLASDSQQGEREFQTEVSLLGRLHHRNLVNLVGYCVDKGQRMLIYEFMTNGSLASLLYGQEERVLSWDERLQIALDISHGIEYLHDGAMPPIIHRDLKSANILLDRSMRAKVADFGLSKEQAFDGCKSSLKGTYGYMDPAYISTNQLTTKSDIFSFGVILFELIVAIPPHQNLMDYINLAAMSPDGVDDILDKRLVGGSNLVVEARSLALIAQKCLHKTPRKRPSIGEVSQAIFKIKHKGLAKEVTMSFTGDDISRMVSQIGLQQVELSKMAAKNMPITG